MIVVDSSAVLAILLAEHDAELYASAIDSARKSLISAASVIEIGVVLLAPHRGGVQSLDRFLRDSQIHVEAVQASHIELALTAYARYGKTRGHAARLNFGDCFSYALAKATGAPLLFKGNDFSHTDIPSVL